MKAAKTIEWYAWLILTLGLSWACSGDSGSEKTKESEGGDWQVWIRQMGTEGWFESGFDVTVDSSGQVYMVGVTAGQLGTDPHLGGSDVFLAKYDSAGNNQWIRQTGTLDSDLGWAVGLDSAGNLYITGNTEGELEGQTSHGSYDAFLIKYDASGNQVWARQFGTTDWDGGFDLVVDDAGTIYVTGMTGSELVENGHQGKTDAFLTQFDADGTQRWTRQFGSSESDRGDGLFRDRDGNLYITGVTGGVLEEGGYQGSFDGFAAKYDASGTLQWIKQFGTGEWDEAENITVNDESGSILIAGSTSGSLNGQEQHGDFDAFVIQLDGDGNHQQTIQFGTTGWDNGDDLILDPSGNLYITGSTMGTLGDSPNQGADDVYLSKYDAFGTLLWTRQIGTEQKDFASALALDSSGNLYVTGNTLGGLDQSPQDDETYDIYLIKINPSLIK